MTDSVQERPFLKFCFERILPADLRDEAARLAIAENPANAPRFATASPAEAALITGKKWAPHKQLRIKFLAGDPVVQNRVKKWANVWMNYTNLVFSWVGSNEPAEIRIDAHYHPDDGSWSNLGTDALVIPVNEPTMRLGWLQPSDPEEDYSSVVLHEFGHGALGLIHEHQSPAANIQWNRPKVYQVLGGPPNNWDKQTIDENLFEKLATDQTQYTQMDPRSIMMYPIDASLTLDGFSVGWNTTLSAMDIQFASEQYPRDPMPPPSPPPGPPPGPAPPPPPGPPPTASVELMVNARPVLRTLAGSGAVDLYRFTVRQPGRHLMAAVQISGASPYTVAWHGHAYPSPNPVERVGSVIVPLDAGTHYWSVRAWDNRSTGNYAASIRRWR